jgi:hypothetical protein
VTVQDLRPNSQDTSAFYLGNIYQVLADPNATRASVPSPVAKPPPFSRPRYAVWVNSLWFLSLVMSLSCALWATSLHQWARRYIRLTQPSRCSPEKRARMHAFFADGVDKMHIPWAVEGLPTLLHLALFLFFSGLAIFLFNVDREVFTCVVWWIGLFTMVYGLITLLPLIRHNSPYSVPLSLPVWFLYASIPYVTFKILTPMTYRYSRFDIYYHRCTDLRNRYRRWMLGGVEKAAEEVASERSSEIDGRILGWTIGALGDDDSLEKFFEAIPGFFKSKLVEDLEGDFPLAHLFTFWGALDGFVGRTLSSNLVTESVKSRRDIICRDIISMIPCTRYYMYENLRAHVDQAPVSIERIQAMARWFTHLSHDVSDAAQIRVARNLLRLQERDNRWVALASGACGLAARDVEHNVALGGDNVLLVLLIHVSRQTIHSYKPGILRLVEALTQIDIHNTLPGLQHNFCTLWNELVQEARNPEHYLHVEILLRIRRLYITLHQSTDAALTAFSASTDSVDSILIQRSSYPLCDIAGHRPDDPLLTQPAHSPDASPHHSTSGGSTVSRQVKQACVIAGLPAPPDPTTPSEIGDSSQAPAAISPELPVHTGSSPTDDVAAALQDIPPAATDISEVLSHASTPAPTPILAPVPASETPILNESMTSRDAGAASTSDHLIPASSVVRFSIPASPPPSRIRTLFRTPFHPTGNTTLPRLRARGLVNSGNMCFANAVLHLLVHSPPFWDLFRELGYLKGQRGAGGPETGSGATPLVHATVRFFEEFVFKEKEPFPTQQLPEQAAGIPREDEEVDKEHNAADSFEPTYMYDAMKEKRQLKILLVRSVPRIRSSVTESCRPVVSRTASTKMRKSF